jgi:hypothetical protein
MTVPVVCISSDVLILRLFIGPISSVQSYLNKPASWYSRTDRQAGNTIFEGSVLQFGPRCKVVGWGTVLQAGKLRVRFPMRLLNFFNLSNRSCSTTALELTQLLSEMSTRKSFGGVEGRPARKADNFTFILSRLSRREIFDISQLYGTPRPVTGIALLLSCSSLGGA